MSADIEEYSLEALEGLDAERKSEKADAKLAELRTFRENISTSLVPIKSALSALQASFQHIQYTSVDDSGILTAEIESYKECLELDSAKLERLDKLLS